MPPKFRGHRPAAALNRPSVLSPASSGGIDPQEQVGTSRMRLLSSSLSLTSNAKQSRVVLRIQLLVLFSSAIIFAFSCYGIIILEKTTDMDNNLNRIIGAENSNTFIRGESEKQTKSSSGFKRQVSLLDGDVCSVVSSEKALLKSSSLSTWKSKKKVPGASRPKTLDDDEWYDDHRFQQESEVQSCSFIADWQGNRGGYPTCNTIHELGMNMGENRQDTPTPQRIKHLASGGFKDVWAVILEDDSLDDIVLKTSVYHRDFTERDLDRHRRDALVMERATSSPHVLNLHSYCSFSGIVESASTDLAHWRDRHYKNLTPMLLLEIAIQLAQGLADMHQFHQGLATVAHADVKPSQYLFINNHFVLNDFNRCRFLTKKKKSVCPFIINASHKGSTYRSPEEYYRNGPQTDKIDVFSFGSVLFFLLTGDAPFEDFDFKDAIRAITHDVQPKLPGSIAKSNDPCILALVETIRWTRQYKHKDRPTSLQVVERLKSRRQEIKERQQE